MSSSGQLLSDDWSDRTWRLQDAKARFSEVARRAREQDPQRVTVHGRDAVVVLDAAAYDRSVARYMGERLVHALRLAPLDGFDFDRLSTSGPVRDVER